MIESRQFTPQTYQPTSGKQNSINRSGATISIIGVRLVVDVEMLQAGVKEDHRLSF